MKVTYFGKDNKYAKATADEGHKLTCFDEETMDVVLFNCYANVTCLAKTLARYHQITDAKAEELNDRKELLAQTGSDDAKPQPYED